MSRAKSAMPAQRIDVVCVNDNATRAVGGKSLNVFSSGGEGERIG